MKKLLLFYLLVAGPVAASGQIIGRPIKTYTSRLGTTVHAGDTLFFTHGQREDGSFKYASIPRQVMATESSLPSTWNGRKAVVKEIREIPYKTGSVYTVVFKSGMLNAVIDFNSAEETGEIRTANNQKKATPATTGGVADELIKLRALLDNGTLTQAEFDAQKAKLLAR
ncbi:SHOCT domain-containing protein [Hymenobacter negativus]|uniref:SHOCT domain-containing protein n=1 Tax=Hymenobacter negativus TaxID=2795026 RepID=A0ABS3QIK9_9BACT|nr:SHOCT domain-containing protein [Hymenobacter negativus]MBO2010863.1 SHOCT domain-containing protein [Hymenobacter negativus]